MYLQILLISITLAIDCAGVSICAGLKPHKNKLTHAFKTAAFFGIFQALMPLLGWLIAEKMKGLVQAVDHWVAFILLAAIGIKMIKDSFENKKDHNTSEIKTLLLLSLATSIDAFIVGITLSILNFPLFFTALAIGIVAFVFSFAGFLLGNKMGVFFGRKVEIIGGFALVAIGFKILLSHLFI